MRALLSGVFLCMAVVAVSAQQSLHQPPPATAMVMGRVVDADTGRPIRGAIVQVEGLHDDHGFPVLTDADGKFVYARLPSGSLTFRAEKGGYHDAQYGQLRAKGSSQALTITDGERRGDVVIRMWHYSAITGTVRDERGEPLVGVPVHAYARAFVAGRARLIPSGTEDGTTDDRGVYRIGTLEPGEYVISIPLVETSVPRSVLESGEAIPGSDKAAQLAFMETLAGAGIHGGRTIASGRMTIVGDVARAQPAAGVAAPPNGRDGSLFSYPTLYYPNVRAETDAQPVRIAAGEERAGVDFELRPLRTVRVSGKVTAPPGAPAQIGLHLLPVGRDGSTSERPVARTITATDGSFTFLGVPAGEFRIHSLTLPPNDDGVYEFAAMGISSGGASITISEESAPIPHKPPAKEGAPQPQVLWASTRVAVGDRDVTGVAVAVRPGIRVSGRVELEGASADEIARELKQIRVSAAAADGKFLPQTSGFEFDQASSIAIEIEKDGRFHALVPPGAYVFRLGGGFPFDVVMSESFAKPEISAIGGLATVSMTLAEGVMVSADESWRLGAVRVNGRDFTDAPLAVGEQDVDGIVLSLTKKSAAIAGVVHAPGGTPEPAATVLLFPTNTDWWTDYGSDTWRVRRQRVGRDGTYGFAELPPGDYFVAAVSEDDRSPSPAPDWLSRISRTAIRVTLSAGENRTQTLTLTSGR